MTNTQIYNLIDCNVKIINTDISANIQFNNNNDMFFIYKNKKYYLSESDTPIDYPFNQYDGYLTHGFELEKGLLIKVVGTQIKISEFKFIN